MFAAVYLLVAYSSHLTAQPLYTSRYIPFAAGSSRTYCYFFACTCSIINSLNLLSSPRRMYQVLQRQPQHVNSTRSYGPTRRS
ncbi:hypothetical protein BC629DRAFT_1561114 [Irpex lacteus]|nr:hypothetical protein BC629DRAFT_1561114 [Irpex lacteus]